MAAKIRRCFFCKNKKPATEEFFYKSKGQPLGLGYLCRGCLAQYIASQRRKHGRKNARLMGLRFQVLKRDSFRCTYCGRSAPNVILEIDHIKPKSRGGLFVIENLTTACKDCNIGKSDCLLETAPKGCFEQVIAQEPAGTAL